MVNIAEKQTQSLDLRQQANSRVIDTTQSIPAGKQPKSNPSFWLVGKELIPVATSWLSPAKGVLSLFGKTPKLFKPNNICKIQKPIPGANLPAKQFLKFFTRFKDAANEQFNAGNYENAFQIIQSGRKLAQSRERLIIKLSPEVKNILDSDFTTLEQNIKFHQNGLNKEITSLEKEIATAKPNERNPLIVRHQQLQAGQSTLDTFDKEIQTPSLNHTNLRNETRRKIITAFLNSDAKQFDEASKEANLLLRVMEREKLVAAVFSELTSQYPSFSSFLGETDLSKKGVKEFNEWVTSEVGQSYQKRGMFEPGRKKVEAMPFIKGFAKIEKFHLGRAALIKGGIRWVLLGDTRQKHIRAVRSPAPKLSHEPENNFRFPVESRDGYQAIEASLKHGKKEILALHQFISEISADESLKSAKFDNTARVNYLISESANGSSRITFLQQMETQEEKISFSEVQKDLQKDIQKIGDFYSHDYEASKEEFFQQHPYVTALFLTNKEDLEKALATGIPFQLNYNSFTNYQNLSNGSSFKTLALGLLDTVNTFHNYNRQPIIDAAVFRDWSKVQKAHSALVEFSGKALVMSAQNYFAESVQGFKKIQNQIQVHQEKLLIVAMQKTFNETELVAKRGSDSLSTADSDRIKGFKSKFSNIQSLNNAKERATQLQSLAGEIQDFVLGITIEQEIAMVKELRKQDSRWQTIKGGLHNMVGNAPNYHRAVYGNFGPYKDQLVKAKRLYDAGKIQEAKQIYYALGQSKQREIIIDRGQSGARWSGLVIGIGIVAASALTAGVLTGALLPVGAQGLSIALSIGRFSLNATAFWASDRVLNSLINDQPLFGKSASTGGKIKELGFSLFENFLLFGTLNGVSKVYSKVLSKVLTPGAMKLAGAEGKVWSQLKAFERTQYLQKYRVGLGKLSKVGIRVGQEAATIIGLNGFNAVMVPDYDIFSWDAQADILMFLGGLHAVSPLSTRLISGIDARKIKRFRNNIENLDLETGNFVKDWQRFQEYQQAPELAKTPEAVEFLKQVDGKILLNRFRNISQKRLRFMEQNPKLFGKVQIEQQGAALQKTEWELNSTVHKAKIAQLTSFQDGRLIYNHRRVKELLDILPEMLGSKNNIPSPVKISIHPNGVLKVEYQMPNQDGHFTKQTLYLESNRRHLTKRQIQKVESYLLPGT